MRIKVLYLITKSNFGGAQRYVFDLASCLPKDQFEPVVALGGNGLLSEKLKRANVRVLSLPSLGREISVFKDIKAFFDLLKILKKEKPDIFHINSSKAGVFGALAGRLSKVPKIIFTAHGWAFNEDRPLWQKIIIKAGHWLTVIMTHQTIAVSAEVKRQMNWPFAQNKMTVIVNGRSLKNLLKSNEARDMLVEHKLELEEFKDDFWTITIAELHPIKRHEATIEVVKKLRDNGYLIRHLIIGAGEQKEALERQIERLELENHVFLLGQIQDASKYLKAADCFVLVSRSEAMPYAVIEAMIAGRPIIATEVGGIPEVIEPLKSGILTPPSDNIALFEAILRLLNDPELRVKLGEGAQERSREFSLEKTLELTLELYNT